MTEVVLMVRMTDGRLFRTSVLVPNGDVAKISVTAFTEDDPMSKLLLERIGAVE